MTTPAPSIRARTSDGCVSKGQLLAQSVYKADHLRWRTSSICQANWDIVWQLAAIKQENSIRCSAGDGVILDLRPVFRGVDFSADHQYVAAAHAIGVGENLGEVVTPQR